MPWLICTQCTKPLFAEQYAPYDDYLCPRCMKAERDRLRTEVKRLDRIRVAAKHLRTQARKSKTLGCNWTCRNIANLFAALKAAETAERSE